MIEEVKLILRTTITVLLLCAPSGGLANPDRIPVVYRTLDGKPYSKVRGFLLSHGNKPLDFGASMRGCDTQHGLCRYAEFETCAADMSACIFIWRTKDGHFLHVQTENPGDRPGAPVEVITKENED